MKLLASVLLTCLFAASAHAQVQQPYPTKEPTPTDFAQLPLAIKVAFDAPLGWQARAAYWAYAVWTRTAVGSGNGAWYRAVSDSIVLTLSKERVFPRPYTCSATRGMLGAFDCVDVLGEPRRVQCPMSLRGAPEPVEWRSEEVAGDPTRGWFYFDWEHGADQKWRAWSDFMMVPLATSTVSDDKQRLTCSYPVTKRVGGPYDQADTWTMWR